MYRYFEKIGNTERISSWTSNNNYPTFKNCLLGVVKLTTNADI